MNTIEYMNMFPTASRCEGPEASVSLTGGLNIYPGERDGPSHRQIIPDGFQLLGPRGQALPEGQWDCFLREGDMLGSGDTCRSGHIICKKEKHLTMNDAFCYKITSSVFIHIYNMA